MVAMVVPKCKRNIKWTISLADVSTSWSSNIDEIDFTLRRLNEIQHWDETFAWT